MSSRPIKLAAKTSRGKWGVCGAQTGAVEQHKEDVGRKHGADELRGRSRAIRLC